MERPGNCLAKREEEKTNKFKSILRDIFLRHVCITRQPKQTALPDRGLFSTSHARRGERFQTSQQVWTGPMGLEIPGGYWGYPLNIRRTT